MWFRAQNMPSLDNFVDRFFLIQTGVGVFLVCFSCCLQVILAILEPHLESAQCPVSVNEPWSLVGSTTPDTQIQNNPDDSPISNEMSLTVTEPR